MTKKDDQKLKEEPKEEVIESVEDEQIKTLETRVTGLEDQLKRAVADYHNLERRVREDSLSIAQFLRLELIDKLLPIVDNLDQSVTGVSEQESQSGWFKGVTMSVKQLHQVLSEEGLKEIDTNGTFDPKYHEAVDTAEGEEGNILKVMQKGYTLNEKVVRPAKVVVGKKQQEKE